MICDTQYYTADYSDGINTYIIADSYIVQHCEREPFFTTVTRIYKGAE